MQFQDNLAAVRRGLDWKVHNSDANLVHAPAGAFSARLSAVDLYVRLHGHCRYLQQLQKLLPHNSSFGLGFLNSCSPYSTVSNTTDMP